MLCFIFCCYCSFLCSSSQSWATTFLATRKMETQRIGETLELLCSLSLTMLQWVCACLLGLLIAIRNGYTHVHNAGWRVDWTSARAHQSWIHWQWIFHNFFSVPWSFLIHQFVYWCSDNSTSIYNSTERYVCIGYLILHMHECHVADIGKVETWARGL